MAKEFIPYHHMDKYTSLKELHEAKRRRVHIITLWDVLKRAFELGQNSQEQTKFTQEMIAALDFYGKDEATGYKARYVLEQYKNSRTESPTHDNK